MTTPTLQPILLDGAWRQADAPTDRFHAFNPSTRATLDDLAYPVSGWADLDAMLDAGQAAAAAMAQLPGETLAGFLEGYADARPWSGGRFPSFRLSPTCVFCVREQDGVKRQLGFNPARGTVCSTLKADQCHP